VPHPVNIDLLGYLRQKRVAPRIHIYHIGHHARDFESFYRLRCPKPYQKLLLSNDLHVPEHVCSTGSNALGMHPGTTIGPHLHPMKVARRADVTADGHMRFPSHCPHQTCRVLPRLSARHYAAALSGGMVYIRLLDASAVNVLLECVMMRTPIFINRLPAVVEVLGPTYPLYVTSEEEVQDLLTAGSHLIEAASLHLSLLDLEVKRGASEASFFAL
jgi:hypothetical protein